MSKIPRGIVGEVLRRPSSIPSLVRSSWAMAPRGWWHRPPFLPLPDEDYWKFRLETANGGEGSTMPSPHEVIDVAAWAKSMRRQRRQRR